MCMRRLRFAFVLVGAFLASSSGRRGAESRKTRSVIMGFPAGSGVDVNRPAAAGAPGEGPRHPADLRLQGRRRRQRRLRDRRKARPDGYTILLAPRPPRRQRRALQEAALDVEIDFHADRAAQRRLQRIDDQSGRDRRRLAGDFIAKVKAAPAKYNFASTGNGTGTHLASPSSSRWPVSTWCRALQGRPEALQAVVTGEVCCIMNQVQTVLGQWRANKVRLLVSRPGQRVGAVQDVPTSTRRACPARSYIWFGLFGPKGLDAAIAEKINLAVKKALELPACATSCNPRQRPALRDRRAVPRHR